MKKGHSIMENYYVIGHFGALKFDKGLLVTCKGLFKQNAP